MMKDPDQVDRQIETGEAIVAMRKDGIVHVYYKAGTEITVTLQIKMLAIFKEMTGGKKSPFIYQAAEYCTVNREARENALAIENSSPTKATVVYVTTLAHRIIAEFYYKVNKPQQPYKVVSDFQAGIKWLLEMDKEIDE
ncbi:MAG TPA: hypothetical protein VK826_02975 [Bacteroidia bacterium]|nr:hypothetical protein [Bacteroidia bacterium]